MLETFHFLRPEWLMAIPLVAVLLYFVLKQSSHNSGWEDICDPVLLQYQLAQQNSQPTKSLRIFSWTLPFFFLIALFALAGPTWEKKEQPVFQQGNALVIILDLSLSMNAKDLKPSRLERAKLKLIDILQQKKEGQTALIAFAGDAHTVSPLTIDNKTIISLLPSLDSSIMPLTGSDLFDALTTAKQLFKNAGFTQGDILLLSDGIDASQQKTLKKSIKQLRQQGYRFSVIGIGSKTGSPIPQPRQGGFIKDSSGQVVLSKLEPASLKTLANIGGGTYHKLSLDDSDFQNILDRGIDQSNNLIDQDTQLEQWVDAGVYFSLLLIPMALLSFRKGLLSLFLCLSVTATFISEPVKAEPETTTSINKQVWTKNLWSTPNQQGQKSFNAQNYQSAADSFSNPKWKASAHYRTGNFEQALEQFSQSDDAASLYNKGNTLANMNKLEEAVNAYEDAVKKASEADADKSNKNQRVVEDASKNLEYIKKILEQQKQQQSEKNSDKQEEESDQQSEKQVQEQEKNADDASKSNESNSDQSEDKESEDSKSEGADSGEKQKENSESDNKSDSQEQDSQNNESNEPEEAKAFEDQKEEAPEDNANNNPQSEPLKKDESDQENTDSAQDDVLSQLSQEEQQSLKQWLQRIPDNPGELLRIKFRNNTLLKQKNSGSTERQYEGNPW